MLAHELGHYTANAYYALRKVNNPIYKGVITRAENRGNRAALRLLVPIDALKRQIALTTDEYEIADYFDVDIKTLTAAVEMYVVKGELNFPFAN